MHSRYSASRVIVEMAHIGRRRTLHWIKARPVGSQWDQQTVSV